MRGGLKIIDKKPTSAKKIPPVPTFGELRSSRFIKGEGIVKRRQGEFRPIELPQKIVNKIGRSKPESVCGETIFVDMGGTLFL
jgi:hypothetical protein